MNTIKKLKLRVFILAFVCSSFVLPLSSMGNSKLPLESVIGLLTASSWYSAYTGDLPVSELSFKLIPNTLDSVEFGNKKYKLVYAKTLFSLDSLWSLNANGWRYFITVLNVDSLILIHQAHDAYFPDIVLIHSKPKPSTTMAKDSLIDKISGIWYSKDNGENSIRFERINSSPDSISCSEYKNDVLLLSLNYKVILAYQKDWELISNKRLYFSINIYNNEIIVSDCNTWGGVCENSHFIRGKPLEIANHFVSPGKSVLYPNPCNESFTLNENIGINMIEIVGLNGQVLLKEKLLKNDKTTINMSGFSQGVYLFRGYTKNDFITVKIVKQ